LVVTANTDEPDRPMRMGAMASTSPTFSAGRNCRRAERSSGVIAR
jgi:hypothetical protein